ncbi:MAG: tyrosinase family protein [Acidobacteriota bacterium]|nr:tyrosinase family protein [Acidobacteriota bacterium]
MNREHSLRIRRSIQELQTDYTNGHKKPLEDLMRAWKGVKELPAEDPRSFFTLGGYHGEPFRGAGWGSSAYWGGYCNHGNILFPTWHRMYLVKLEEALQSVAGCEEVMMPYWDETSDDSLQGGIPWALTQKDFVLDGVTIPNPLRSFVFTKAIKDNINGDDPNYSKPQGYETVRYPLSGLVGTEADRAATDKHNAMYPDYDGNVQLLNENIKTWLTSTVIVNGKPTSGGHVAAKYKTCLDAPNYTVFSNTTSAGQWNDDHARQGAPTIVPLESPHNSIHLAVGGFDVPNVFDASPIEGANGDMGENDTAGLDPIFFFHHCFVDRIFWLWQKHGFTDKLEVIPEYPGTNSVDSQGPTPGTVPNSWLTLESPLDPFKIVRDGKERPCTSLDCINIEKQLGFTYSQGSLEEESWSKAALPAAGNARVIGVTGINRAPIRGSFLVSVFGKVGGERVLLGTEAVLSRWSVQSCANCQAHLEVKAFVQPAFKEAELDSASYDVEIRTRDGVLTQSTPLTKLANALSAVTPPAKRLFRLEVR